MPRHPARWLLALLLALAVQSASAADPVTLLRVDGAIGPASARLQVQYSPDSAGSTEAFTWVEGRLGWTFTPRLDGTVALGRREQDNAPDYTAWNAGVTYALTDALALDVRYYDTDAAEFGEQYEDALVAEIAFAF